MKSTSRHGLRRAAPICSAFTSVGLVVAGLVIASAAILTLGNGALSAVPRPTGLVYTANEFGNSISKIDVATGRVETVDVPMSPHNVDLSADGKMLLAVGEPSAVEGGGHGRGHMEKDKKSPRGLLLVFESGSLGSGPVAVIGVGEHPAHVIPGSDSLAFVTLSEENAVAVVDLARKSVIRTIATARFPHGMRVSPDGEEIYVAAVKEGAVSVLGVAAMKEIARIPVGAAPVQVGFTPDGSKVVVSLRDENKVAVIDTASRKVVAKVDVGRKPIQVFVTPDGSRVYVANQGDEADPDDTVSVIDLASLEVVETIRTGRGAHGVVISPDGSRVFVTNIVDGTISKIDEATRAVLATIPVGAGPNGVAFRSTK